MTPERYQEVGQLYRAALAVEADQRAAFLGTACGGDEALRQEVESLLGYAAQPGGIMDQPALEVAAQALAADQHKPSSPKLEQRTAPDTLNTEAAGGDDLKHQTKSGSTGRGRSILVGFFFTLMSVSIAVNSYHGNLYFSTAGDPGWLPGLDSRVRMYGDVSAADISALRDGDEVVSLDGQKLGSIREYFKTFTRLTPGAAYTMVVRRDGRMEQLTLRTASYPRWIRVLAILYQPLLPAVFLMIGLAIFLLRRDDKQALLLALMFGMMFLGGWPPFALFVTDLPWWLAGITTVALLIGAAGVSPILLHFFLIFPERAPLLHRFPRLEFYLYPFYWLTAYPFVVIAVFRLATAPARFFGAVQEFQWPIAIILAVSGIYLLSALLSLAVNYRRGNQVSRRKLRLILVGTMVAFMSSSLIRFSVLFLKPSLSLLTPLWLIALSVGFMMMLLLFPLSFAYAIVRHQVIPVSLVIRRSLQYLLAKNALRLLLALPLVGLALTVYANRDRTLADLLFHNSVWFYISLLAAVTLGYAYRRNLRDWLDRRFFREVYQQDKILRELTEEVRQLDSQTEMAQHVSRKVNAALHPERLYLFYRAEGRRDLACAYSSGGLSRDARIPAEFELLRFMEYQGGAQDFPFPARTKLPVQEKEWLASLGACLIVPLRGTDDRLTGLLVLGAKKSEIPYTGSDRQLLETLADQIALVYENAQLKERVAKDRRVQHEVLTRIAEQQINLLKECPQCGTCYDSAARVCPKDQAELELTLPVERTLEGKYRLERLLGKGGMGAVYEASDLRLGRRVAVKIMTGRLFGDQAALRRFEREARASARLNHPNIIAVHDYGRAGAEGAYLVMELVVGTTLRDDLKGAASLLPADAAMCFEQILAGLQAAHDAGVIHRDLKPENVLVARQEDGRTIIKLLDFGLAKLRTLDAADASSPPLVSGLTTPGTIMGTFGYMSPEQLLGEEVDERTDIFAVGVMVVEALTGRRPFEGKSQAGLLNAVLHQPFTLPGNTPLIRQLDAVLQKCLAKERTSRYATVTELQMELILALRAFPPLASLEGMHCEPDAKTLLIDLKSLQQEPEFEAQRKPAMPPALSAVQTKIKSDEGEAVETAKAVAANIGDAAARTTSNAEYLISEIKRHKTGVSILLAALAVVILGGLVGLSKFVSQKSSDQATIQTAKPAATGQSMKIQRLTADGKIESAAISPDGKYVAYVVKEGERQSLWMRLVATNSRTQIEAPAAVNYGDQTFSPDGTSIYYVASDSKHKTYGTLYQVSVLGGAPRKILANIRSSITFSPDSNRFAFVRNDETSSGETQLIVVKADGTDERILAARKGDIWFPPFSAGPAWSPDGKVIACGAGSYSGGGSHEFVIAVEVETGKQQEFTAQRWFKVGRVAWLADGGGLVVNAKDQGSPFSQIWQLSYPRGEVRKVTVDLNDYDGISLTSDSKSFVAVQGDWTSNIWIAPGGDANRAQQITFGKLEGGTNNLSTPGTANLAWTPDGRIVYTSMASGNLDLWSMNQAGTEPKQLTTDPNLDWMPAVSPDGRSIVFGSFRAGFSSLWRMDLDGGNLKPLTARDDDKIPQISPDGRWIVFSSWRSGKFALWKMPLEGGTPIQLSDKFAEGQAISPDGKLIAAFYVDEQPDSPTKIMVIPFAGGAALKTFDLPPSVETRGGVRWTPDGRALTYIDTRGTPNLWSQPYEGGSPKPLTHFKDHGVLNCAWSGDGKWLALVRGTVTKDVVLIKDFR